MTGLSIDRTRALVCKKRHRVVRVDICGGIAAGKTTLANLFQRHIQVVLEDYTKNPYWERSYQNPQRYAFETEISFLIQHYSLIKDAAISGTLHIFDFSPLQDLAYADLNLCSSRWQAFEGLYRQVAQELGEPGILVHLVCSAEEELERIRRRNRRVETSIQLNYLRDLNDAISTRVVAAPPAVHVVTIDSSDNDFANKQVTQTNMRGLILAAVDSD